MALIYAVLALSSFFVADSLITASKPYMLPTQAPPGKISSQKSTAQKRKSEYAVITRRNPFNSDGIIPKPLSSDIVEKPGGDQPPVPSQLPLKLVGTIVHGNPTRSVATIQNSSQSLNKQFQAYRVGYEIKGMATILSVSRKRVVFRNINNGRKEFIEIKEDVKFKIGLSAPKAAGPKKEVEREGNRFILKRSDVLKHTSNLPELLQQARAVPNIIPGSGGQVDGFRLLEMEKGSIFEKLGLKRMDVIKGINGEPINSPAKAMELYNELKTAGRIDLEIERNGRPEVFNYIIE